jgi:hypothetical protein
MKEGTKVTFTKFKHQRNGCIRMSSVEGVLVEQGDAVSTVRCRGKLYRVSNKNLREVGQPNALTEAFMAMKSEDA